jgi:hypothetical protein
MTYLQWKMAAAATLRWRHRLRANHVPEKHWRHWFILGLPTDDAVERAEAYHNDRIRSAADRRRNRIMETPQ